MNGQLCSISGLERLLLSTDCSEFSEGAIRESINIAKKCSSKLYVLSVIETFPEVEISVQKLIEKAEKETTEQLESIKAWAFREGVECEISVYHGEEPSRYIVEEALNKNVKMIVMGRRGRTGLKRLMIGSVTARVISRATCNVLVVPRAARIEFKNILVAIGYSKYSNALGSEAISIAKCSEGTLLALSVASGDAEEVKEGYENLNKVKRMAEKEGLKVDILCEKGRPYEVILNKTKEKDADLIVVGSPGRAGFKRHLMESVTEKVIRFSGSAVLVVNTKTI